MKTRVPITGGLAGDDADFEKTLVGLNCDPREGEVVAIGFYGNHLKIGYGSFGGWDTFGTERIITKSEGNILYELDDKSALALYKEYLGDLASELPGSALLFPLRLKTDSKEEFVVRTILDIDEKNQAMIFAGDIPQGAKAQLMRANFDRLIDGAATAANFCIEPFKETQPSFALLISCVGRRLVLGQRVEEELEECANILGENVNTAGFYSYGEISPFNQAISCKLHNQTMTITTFAEI